MSQLTEYQRLMAEEIRLRRKLAEVKQDLDRTMDSRVKVEKELRGKVVKILPEAPQHPGRTGRITAFSRDYILVDVFVPIPASDPLPTYMYHPIELKIEE